MNHEHAYTGTFPTAIERHVMLLRLRNDRPVDDEAHLLAYRETVTSWLLRFNASEHGTRLADPSSLHLTPARDEDNLVLVCEYSVMNFVDPRIRCLIREVVRERTVAAFAELVEHHLDRQGYGFNPYVAEVPTSMN